MRSFAALIYEWYMKFRFAFTDALFFLGLILFIVGLVANVQPLLIAGVVLMVAVLLKALIRVGNPSKAKKVRSGK